MNKTLFAAAVVTISSLGCQPLPSADAFRFAVAEPWPMQTAEGEAAEDRMLAAGRVTAGAVRVGDEAVIHCEGGAVTTVVEVIHVQEEGDEKPHKAPEATQGQSAALQLRGISPKRKWLEGREITGRRGG